jgi:hypothetical protein
MNWTIVFIQDQSVQRYKSVLDTEFRIYNKDGLRNTVIDCGEVNFGQLQDHASEANAPLRILIFKIIALTI